jgi:hypothetical protein
MIVRIKSDKKNQKNDFKISGNHENLRNLRSICPVLDECPVEKSGISCAPN